MKSVVFYAVVHETEDDGIFLDFPFFGGVATTPLAEQLAKDITDDRAIPGTAIITKIYRVDRPLIEIKSIAHRQFCQKAVDMYDVEDMQERRASSKRRKK